MSLHRSSGRPRAATGLAFAALLAAGSAVAVPVGAQDGGKGFLFREPVFSVSLRGGFAYAQAGGELLSEARQVFTLDRNDFNSAVYGADLAFRVSPRLDFTLGASVARTSTPSEHRDWEEGDDIPIAQTTDFQRIPVNAGVKFYLAPRGRSVGQFAWVPSRLAPYVGAGVGKTWYRYRQVGDFVADPLNVEGDHPIFTDRFESSGWTTSGHALAGVDMTLSNHVALTAEARYGYAKARLSSDFVGYDPIDLSGATATVGLLFRF